MTPYQPAFKSMLKYLPYPSGIDVCCWLKLNHIGKVDAYCHQANIIQYSLNIEKMKSNIGHVFQ